tara:strand:+ start:967 stop:1590 length:624 start_codon:yes stop_codon:yes gene_type:complete
MSTLYKEELNFEENVQDLVLKNLSKFLDENIFKVEKLLGNFINNIFVIIDVDKIFNIDVSLKKKNYDELIKFKTLESLLVEAKDLFNENHKDSKIMHMIINKYIIDGESYLNFVSDLKTDFICLEVNFICIPKKFSLEINQMLDKYHIQINRFLYMGYINNLFLNKEIEPAHKISKVLSGFNENEVNLVLKNPKKIGFFEKFFQLFS